MPGEWGGARPGAGRPKSENVEVVKTIRQQAQAYAPAIIERLAEMAGVLVDAEGTPIPSTETSPVRQVAMKELLDRGLGKSTQFLASDDSAGGLTIQVVKFSTETPTN